MEPPVAECAKDLDPIELKELEFAPERPTADLPEAKIPPAEPLGQLVGVTGSQRLQEHEASPDARFNRRRLQFSDLIILMPEIAWKRLKRSTSSHSGRHLLGQRDYRCLPDISGNA
jgi:hypothetical protein